ncbi:MAG: hypothetical protein EOO99_01755 [Pedobacter sp.]|nr:MAG: hypothetical protein EOO99_01755 [Pedobacter sp.]
MKLKSILLTISVASVLFACKKEETPIDVLPPAEVKTLTLNGKSATSNYDFVVYVDLSEQKATPVNRKSWNIAISNGSINKVFINPSYQSTTVATNANNLSAVSSQNPGTTVNLDHSVSDPNSVNLVDYYDGTLNRTAYVGEISTNDDENKVHLLSFEGNKSITAWYKYKVTRTANGCQVQYGRINDTQFKTIQVPNDEKNVLSFISFESDKLVSVEPETGKWDFAWGYSTADSGNGAPFWVEDYVFTNSLIGVKVSEIPTAAVSFDNFGTIHLSGFNALGFRNSIGTNWRSLNPATGIKTDRFYVIQDPDGSIFKLKFTKMGVNDDGERGRPKIEYVQIH